ncbi:MAG TPA: hypothetical protein PKD23_05770, partial [Bellilinea sp.]|nr:hypothetical protein [Bellilinea sp.]
EESIKRPLPTGVNAIQINKNQQVFDLLVFIILRSKNISKSVSGSRDVQTRRPLTNYSKIIPHSPIEQPDIR